MTIPGIRLIVPLLCGLLLLAGANSDAKEKAKPSPTPTSKRSSAVVSIGKVPSRITASPTPKPNAPTTVSSSKSNQNDRMANPKARTTSNPDANKLTGVDLRPSDDAKPKYKAKASPTPKAK